MWTKLRSRRWEWGGGDCGETYPHWTHQERAGRGIAHSLDVNERTPQVTEPQVLELLDSFVAAGGVATDVTRSYVLTALVKLSARFKQPQSLQ